MEIREPEFPAKISRYKNVLYLCHRNADPDAIGSGFALQQAFGGALGAIDDISKAGMSTAAAIGAKPLINPQADDYDLAIVVDASVRLQLGRARLGRYAVVDHHLDQGLLEDAEFYIQREASSTAEIVWRILLEAGAKMSREMALGLLLGIVSDTGRFRRGSPGAFRAVGDLLERGGLGYDEVLGVLSTVPTEISQRMAVLTAARRAEVERTGEWLVASTEINAFEGSSAMALVDIGADVAFAAGRHGDLVRISGRARREVCQAGLNLAEIMRAVASEHAGEGGGHRGAAALEAKGDASAILAECRRRAVEALRS
jgi:nanoRNase/pAp phosphatase (c-di-AMP/oligoRNAs hydrolase)